MDAAVEIRAYEPRDRQAVREICRSTAYGGAEEALIDPHLFVDLMIRAYTDFAAGSVWVAERRGGVGGYLAGGFDRGRLHRVQAWRAVPGAVARGLGRRLPWRRSLWRLPAALPGLATAARPAGGPRGRGARPRPRAALAAEPLAPAGGPPRLRDRGAAGRGTGRGGVPRSSARESVARVARPRRGEAPGGAVPRRGAPPRAPRR